ncbi:SphA family protein [Bradyrhizobium symbiodeficiens]|uniref:SphA family protein n=1 Tax=Bradyrhizobium symbiodeficiens TaxID=1404367 RepID=UPI002FE6889E
MISRRRLKSEPAGQYWHRSWRHRLRRRLHLFESDVRHGIRGLTYNFKNPDTQYQSGIDFHLDWGVSQFLSKQVFVGFVGYAYQQVTDDFGQPAVLGSFRSRVLGVGPQIGYIFPIGSNQAFLGLKGYGEFDAANRPSGWNTWLTFSISEAAPASAVAPTRHKVSK